MQLRILLIQSMLNCIDLPVHVNWATWELAFVVHVETGLDFMSLWCWNMPMLYGCVVLKEDVCWWLRRMINILIYNPTNSLFRWQSHFNVILLDFRLYVIVGVYVYLILNDAFIRWLLIIIPIYRVIVFNARIIIPFSLLLHERWSAHDFTADWGFLLGTYCGQLQYTIILNRTSNSNRRITHLCLILCFRLVLNIAFSITLEYPGTWTFIAAFGIGVFS